ncbi:MAG: hypothetical protein AAFO03_08170 [Bacteroidota bacterium]
MKGHTYLQSLIPGGIYYVRSFTAPKYFNGLYFECLLTDQKIAAHAKALEFLGTLSDYDGEVWNPERFNNH